VVAVETVLVAVGLLVVPAFASLSIGRKKWHTLQKLKTT
jgi:hypothetical protein